MKKDILIVETIGMGKKGAAFAEAFKKRIAEEVLKVHDKAAKPKTKRRVRRLPVVLALAATLGLVSLKPADAHGFWPGFAAGLATGFVAPYVVPPPIWYPPEIYYHQPGGAVIVPTPLMPDPAIRFAQHALNVLGFGPLNEDGLQGPATWSAVTWFQSVNGLWTDGIVGSGTMAVLQAQLAARIPPPPPPPPPHVEK